jgi:hypothetical protein
MLGPDTRQTRGQQCFERLLPCLIGLEMPGRSDELSRYILEYQPSGRKDLRSLSLQANVVGCH